MTHGTAQIRLVELEMSHVTDICRLFSMTPDTINGYLAEEVFGWSISRVIMHDGRDAEAEPALSIKGLIQVTKLNSDKGYGVLGTWLVPAVWGTGVNAAAKQLLLQELFDTRTDIQHVYLCIEASNSRSIMAARKLTFAVEIAESAVPNELVADVKSESVSSDFFGL